MAVADSFACRTKCGTTKSAQNETELRCESARCRRRGYPRWPAAPRRAIGVKELSWLLSLSQQAIRLYMCTPSLRHLAPPNAFKLPGHAAWRWWLDEVLEWMASGEREKLKRPRGKPKGSTARALRAKREAERAAQAEDV